MRENNAGSIGESLMLFVAGAAIGGLLVALNTPKTGPELREDLKGMGRRAKNKAEGLAEDAEGAWDKLKGKAGETGEALKQELTEAGKR
jgi:gas vesicle protein